MKITTILACATLSMGGCTGPGLEPPFGGKREGGDPTSEPNGVGGGTTAENASDAGISDPGAARDSDAGSDDD